ncbi:hypothetical protein CYY_008317 [Polysphondylium violaceum]|uniref:Purple acid phosphatase n=1 Tax=Polysphondylium violaceum TaxID=133409 RepID=A0A8J4PVF2_9MYCE|nr:hypothetical protein CYY_008317 [Polysphondylium violaceum]
MDIPYKVSYFLIFLLLPFMGAILLVLIKFLFLDEDSDKTANNSGKNSNCSNTLALIISCLYIVGFTFTLISFSSWSFISVYVVMVLNVPMMTCFTLYQLVKQLKLQRKRQKVKVVNINTLNSTAASPIINNSNGDGDGDNSGAGNGQVLSDLLGSPKLRNGFYEINLQELNGGNRIEPIGDDESDLEDQDYRFYYENTLQQEGEQEGAAQEFYFNSLDLHSKHHLSYRQRMAFKASRFKWDVIKVWQYKKMVLVASVLVSVFLGIMLPLAFENVCICSHPMSLSTALTRSTYCPSGQVCFVYLSLPKDPSHSMIIQFHTRDKPLLAYITYQQESSNSSSNSNSNRKEITNYLSMGNVIRDEPRYVSFVDLVDLKPDTEYWFNVHVESSNHKVYNSRQYSFKTLPFNNDDVRFIVGGDIQMNSDAVNLGKLVSDYQPHFVVIGGDIAYEDGIGSCYQRWDERLLFFQNTLAKDNRLTPLVLSIGNHEAGAFFQSYKQVPFYFHYFVFKIGDSMLSVDKRESFHVHKISTHSSIVSLDSCVTKLWSEQVEWLDNTWSSVELKDTMKMTVYHTPIFPAYSPLDSKIAKLGIEYMVPLFDKFNVPLSFENHEHLFKRTKPLRHGQVSPQGTVYVGDGAWGISSNQRPTNNPHGIFEKTAYSNHIWFVNISIQSEINSKANKTISLRAIAPDGQAIDEFDLVPS